MLSGKSAAQARPTALGTLVQASTYGMVLPTYFGTVKGALLAIWAANLRKGGSSAKKGKKKSISTYVENIDFLIGSNPIQGCLQAWLNSNRYPLNFQTYRHQLIGSGGTITVPDSNFYAVVGVTVELTLSGTFNDYGAGGSTSWGPTVYEYPLWNKQNAGPDIADTSGARWWPYTFWWNSTFGATVKFPDWGTLSTLPAASGFVNIYYAQLSSISHTQAPIAFNRMTFESQLGNGPEFSGDFNNTSTPLSSQQIIYPEYAGLGSPDIDLGATGLLPTINVEVQGSHCLYSRGDADFMDMIEDVLKSGVMQVGQAL